MGEFLKRADCEVPRIQPHGCLTACLSPVPNRVTNNQPPDWLDTETPGSSRIRKDVQIVLTGHSGDAQFDRCTPQSLSSSLFDSLLQLDRPTASYCPRGVVQQ